MGAQTFTPEARAHRAWRAGQQLGQRGRWEEAADQFRAARRLQPRDALYAMQHAQALLQIEKIDMALEAVEAASRLQPESVSLLQARAECLKTMKRHQALVDLLVDLPQEKLNHSLLKMLGEAQGNLGRQDQAVQAWLKALTLEPTNPHLYERLGFAFHELSLKREAAECLRTSVALRPGYDKAGIRDILYLFEREVCNWKDGNKTLEALAESIRRMPADTAELVNPFAFAVLHDDPAVNLRASRSYASFIERAMPEPFPPRTPQSSKRLRIGYVSSDFYQHATSILMVELLEAHDRERFEVFLYSHGHDDGSPMSRRVRDAAEHFVEMRDANLLEMARRIRDDQVDILVDLKGYTKESRFQLFACRPAPLQVSYLGFPGTSGARFIDYIIGDPWVTPLSHADRYSEKIAQLPGCYQCNDGRRAVPSPARRADHGLPEDAFVFCGFNQPYKISPQVFDVWCGLLHQVPKSVLWLLDWSSQARDALLQEAAARGVDASRLVFAPVLPASEHLDRMACADLFLDTWPCNGHTTASDALWAGLPIVTCSGETFASRVAGSLLRAVGLEGLVCDSVEAYQSLALSLALDPCRQQALKATLKHARSSSTLFDGRARARELEALYERMWGRALQGLAPDHLHASDERSLG